MRQSSIRLRISSSGSGGSGTVSANWTRPSAKSARTIRDLKSQALTRATIRSRVRGKGGCAAADVADAAGSMRAPIAGARRLE